MVNKSWTFSGGGTRALLVVASLFLFVIAHAFAAEPRRVLIIHAFGHAYSPWSDIAASFRAELIKNTKEPIDLYEVSLDTARVQSREDETPFVDYIHALLGGRKLDLIVPIGAPSAFFMQRNRQRIFPAAPMLIVGADRRRIPDYSLTENDATVLIDVNLPGYLANILRVRPETTEIAVVVGNSPVERYWTSELRRDFQPLAGRVKIDWLNDLTFGEMLKRAATMPPTGTILWYLLSEDAAGVPYSQDSALEAMRQIASVPIFGIGDYQMGRGIVGGPLMQIRKLGEDGAKAALRILKGEMPSAVKTPNVLYGAPIFDWRELRHWNISETLLPPDSIVQFREPNVWQRYRWQFIAVAIVLLAQAVAIAGLILERRRRRIAELRERQRLMEVIHLNRSAIAGAMSASVAHELGQPLGAIQSNAEAAVIHLQQSPPDIIKIGSILTRILHDNKRAASITTHFRRLLKKQGEAETREIDLNDIITETMEIVGAEALKNGVDLVVYKPNGALPVRVDFIQLQQVLINIAMNAIDAMRHCDRGERKLSVDTALNGSSVEVSVADTGTGIPPEKLNAIFDAFYSTKGHGTGLGLSIARTIVEAFDGRMWAENRPGGGALFRFTLPLSKTADATRAS